VLGITHPIEEEALVKKKKKSVERGIVQSFYFLTYISVGSQSIDIAHN